MQSERVHGRAPDQRGAASSSALAVAVREAVAADGVASPQARLSATSLARIRALAEELRPTNTRQAVAADLADAAAALEDLGRAAAAAQLRALAEKHGAPRAPHAPGVSAWSRFSGEDPARRVTHAPRYGADTPAGSVTAGELTRARTRRIA